MHKVFVYGTLKNYDAEDTHTVRGQMWNLGSFPCVLLGGDNKVPGQIIEVNDERLRSLDRYEGVPNLYTREKCTATSIDRTEGVDVFIYQWAGYREHLNRSPLINNWPPNGA